MSVYAPSASYFGEFTTSSATGAATDADSLPTVTANRNGTDDGTFALTATRIDTGRYKVTGTVPSGYASGDRVNLSVAATIGGIAAKTVIDTIQVGVGVATDANGKVLLQATQTGVTIPTVSTLTGNTPQTGDAFVRLGATPPTAAAIVAAFMAYVISLTPTANTAEEALAAAHSLIDKNVYAPPSGGGAGTGSRTHYMHDQTTVLKTQVVTVDSNDNATSAI